MSKTRIGVLSFAHGHVNAYCHQIVNFDDAELVAAWDDNETRGQRQCETFGMTYTPHVEDVLGNPDIDAVMIASETNKHADLCVAAAEAGKNILLQKPMALTLEDCDRIIAAAEKAGVHFTTAYQMRCDPVNQKMVELVKSGSLGKIGLVRRRHCIPVLFNEGFVNGDSSWHIDPVANKGMFMDDATHPADFLYWLLGQPKTVMAEIDNVLTNSAPDDSGIALYRFPGGTMVDLINTSVCLAGENTTEIYGDQAVLIQNYGDAVSTGKHTPESVALKRWDRDGSAWQHYPFGIPKGHGERIAAVARPWLDTLREEREPFCTARDGRVSVAMVLAAYESAATGRRVEVPQTAI